MAVCMPLGIRMKSLIVRPYAGAVGPRFLLMHNNARPHVARVCRQSAALPGILSPMKRNVIGPFYRPAKKKCDAILYKTMQFNDIFDYHSHICEKNNMTVTWLLLTVSLVVTHAGLIYLHNGRLTGGGTGSGLNKYINGAIWLLQFNLLISRKYKHFSDCTELYCHTVCMHQKCSFPTAKQEGEPQTTDQTFYFHW